MTVDRDFIRFSNLPPLVKAAFETFLDNYDLSAVIADVVATADELNILAAANSEIAAGAGITDGTGTIHRAAAVRIGGIIRTSILLDLTDLASSTTDLDIIGTGASAAYIAQITDVLNGTVLTGRMTCLEVPVGGADDIDLYMATEGTGKFNDLVTDLTETVLITAGGAWTLGLTKVFATPPTANKYIYVTGGEGGTAASYTAGKFLIEMEGYDA